jgi:peptide/nickel transport system substrate-binding protein
MSSLRTQKTKGLGWRGIVINVGNKTGLGNLPYSKLDTPLASSPALRQAFEQAIDRNALNRVVYGGTTQIGCTPVSPSSETFDATIRCTPYDPANAKKLVARSGFPNPTVHLLVQDTTEQLRVAEFIQAQEKAVGINVVIDARAPYGPYLASGNFDTALAGPAIGASTDRAIFDWFGTSGSDNYGGYSNPRLDQILANSRKATSPAALKTLYHAAEQILAADRPAIILYHSVRFAGVSADVVGVETRSADLLLRVAFARYR